MTNPAASNDRANERAVEIRIVGEVQGVGFRYSTRECALKLGIRGQVRNEPDGSVHVLAEADSDRLMAFLAWCDRGPRASRVDSVTSTDIEPQGFEDFRISVS